MMKKQQGLTLIEIMVALMLGLFIIAATVTVYINTIRSSSYTIKSARLNYDLGMAMSLMVNDIKRAGYWGGAVISSATLLSNPFTNGPPSTTTPVTDIQIPTADCILYTYDANNSGTLTPTVLTDDVDENEYYGFKLSAGSIWMRTTGATTANCADGNWNRITDENTINITSVQFSFTPLGTLPATSRCFNSTDGKVTDGLTCTPIASGDKIAQKRIVNIQLTGTLVSDADVTKTLEETIKVRNNRVFTQP